MKVHFNDLQFYILYFISPLTNQQNDSSHLHFFPENKFVKMSIYYNNGHLQIYFRDSKLPFPEQRYERKEFISQSKELRWDSKGKYNDPATFLVDYAKGKARQMNANAIIDATFNDVRVEKTVFNSDTKNLDTVVKIVREFQGTAVHFF